MEAAIASSLKEILQVLATRPVDDTAWNRLYECTRTYVFRTSCYVLRSETHLADDATQEVYFRLARYCTFRHFEDPHAFLAYVRVICRNVARSLVAQTKRRGELPLQVVIDEALLTQDHELNRELSLTQLRTIVLARLDHSVANRTILELWLKGSSIVEIASEVGITYSAAAVRLHRMRRALTARNINKIETSQI